MLHICIYSNMVCQNVSNVIGSYQFQSHSECSKLEYVHIFRNESYCMIGNFLLKNYLNDSVSHQKATIILCTSDMNFYGAFFSPPFIILCPLCSKLKQICNNIGVGKWWQNFLFLLNVQIQFVAAVCSNIYLCSSATYAFIFI